MLGSSIPFAPNRQTAAAKPVPVESSPTTTSRQSACKAASLATKPDCPCLPMLPKVLSKLLPSGINRAMNGPAAELPTA